jgi:hypothetical protein
MGLEIVGCHVTDIFSVIMSRKRRVGREVFIGVIENTADPSGRTV